jgi:hypothetical protein
MPPATAMRRSVCEDGGEIEQTYWCPVCVEILDTNPASYQDGIGPGDLLENEPELWNQVAARQAALNTTASVNR